MFVVIIVSLCLSGFMLESFGPNVGSCVVVLGYLCLYVCVCVSGVFLCVVFCWCFAIVFVIFALFLVFAEPTERSGARPF